MSKPRVLHVASGHLSTGGVERFLLNVCQSLQNEYAFALLSGADVEFQSRIGNVGCSPFFWNVKRSFDVRAAKDFLNIFAHYQPQIVHLHDARAALIVRLTAWRTETKIAYTVHLPPYYYRWKVLTAPRRFVYAQIERFLNSYFTDAVVYPSVKGWKEALEKRYVPSRKAFCIPNGIDLTLFASAQCEHRRPNKVPVICTLARLSKEKNVGLLLEAAALLVRRGFTFRLWIVGDGPQREDLESRAKQLGISEYTQFLGARADPVSLLCKADIFVLTSWYEGRSLSVMEAQAAALPCVLSDVDDHALMVRNGCGRLFPPGDARACAEQLEWLLSHPQNRIEMGRVARAQAFQEYSLQLMVEKYRILYSDLMGNRV